MRPEKGNIQVLEGSGIKDVMIHFLVWKIFGEELLRLGKSGGWGY